MTFTPPHDPKNVWVTGQDVDKGKVVDLMDSLVESAKQAVTLSDAQTVGGKKTMSGGVTGLPAPVSNSDAVRKIDLDTLQTAVAGGGTNRTYGSTAAAEADGGLANGAFYNVVPSAHDGGAYDIYTKGSPSVYKGTVASASGVALAGESTTEGSAAAGTPTAVGVNTYFHETTIPNDGVLTDVSFQSHGPGKAFLVVASLGGGNFTLQAIQEVLVQLGANSIKNFNPTVQAGWYVGIFTPLNSLAATDYAVVAPGRSIPNTAFLVADGVVGDSSPAGTVVNGSGMLLQYTVSTGLLAETLRAMAAEAVLEDEISGGGTSVTGINPPVFGTNSTHPPGNTLFCYSPTPSDGLLSVFRFYSRNGGSAKIVVASYNPDTAAVTLVHSKDVGVQVGVNTANMGVYVEAGWYVGIYSGDTETPDYVNASGLSIPYTVGLTGVETDLQFNPNIQIEASFDVITGLENQLAWVAENGAGDGGTNDAAQAGIGLLDGADSSGIVDAAAVFAGAQASHPSPYVQQGTFSLSSLFHAGRGLWGSDKAAVSVNGVRLSLPEKPERFARLLQLRARLMSQIWSGSAVIFNGDSITVGAFATDKRKTYVSRFTEFANLGIAIDEPVLVNFDNTDGAGGLAFNGLALSGSQVLDGAGPVGKALSLQPAQVLTLDAAAYERVDVTFERKVAAGTLAFKFNGGAAYKTVNCSGSAASDVSANAGATGQAGAGVYTITNTGSDPVVITSLMRFGIKAVGSAPRLYVCRFAHGGYKFTDYGATQMASMLRIAAAAGGGNKPLVIPALGVNDSQQGNYATVNGDAAAYVAAWVAAGVPVRDILPIMPWRWSSYPSGKSFESGNAAVRDAYAAAGITKVIQTDGIDFVGWGLTATGDGHPSDDGFLYEFNSVVDALVSL